MIYNPETDKNIAAPDMNKLLDQYGNSILRMCFLYLKDIHMAEDAVQDTLIKVYKSYSNFNGNSTEKTWIMRIAINVCKNYIRRSWWRNIDPKASLETISVDDNIIQDNSVLLEIMKLSPKYKEVILLFYYQDMKIREIAETLQISEATVATRLKRGRERLKNNLEGWFYDE